MKTKYVLSKCMTDSSCTVVTMLFDICLSEEFDNVFTNKRRPIDFYFNQSKSVLSLQNPMVIFCDNNTVDKLKEMREAAVGTNIPTQYIVKNIVEYDFYKLHVEQINSIRKTHFETYKTQHGVLAWYTLITMFKYLALFISKQHNFFNTTHYAWVDVGCTHIVKSFDEYAPLMLNNPRSKVSVCYIHYRSRYDLYPIDKFLNNRGPCGIAAGAYTVEASYVDKLYHIGMSVFHEQLFNKYIHSDEQVLTYCYDKNPEIFNLYYGDYYSIFTNYHKPNNDQQSIYKYFIQNALRNNRPDLAVDAARQILSADYVDESLKNKLIEIVSQK